MTTGKSHNDFQKCRDCLESSLRSRLLARIATEPRRETLRLPPSIAKKTSIPQSQRLWQAA
jgi:hypothetical protein